MRTKAEQLNAIWDPTIDIIGNGGTGLRELYFTRSEMMLWIF